MVNQDFMKALAMLESVAATEQERNVINNVRGMYVAKFGGDNPFVKNLAQLESVAATKAERDEINTIRGKFGLMEMTNFPEAKRELNDIDEFHDEAFRNAEYEKMRGSIPKEFNPKTQFSTDSDDVDFDDWSDLAHSDLLDDPEEVDDEF